MPDTHDRERHRKNIIIIIFFYAFLHHVCLAFLAGSVLAFAPLKKGGKIMPIMQAKKYQISYTS